MDDLLLLHFPHLLILEKTSFKVLKASLHLGYLVLQVLVFLLEFLKVSKSVTDFIFDLNSQLFLHLLFHFILKLIKPILFFISRDLLSFPEFILNFKFILKVFNS